MKQQAPPITRRWQRPPPLPEIPSMPHWVTAPKITTSPTDMSWLKGIVFIAGWKPAVDVHGFVRDWETSITSEPGSERLHVVAARPGHQCRGATVDDMALAEQWIWWLP